MGQNDILGILFDNKKKFFTTKQLSEITGYTYSSVSTCRLKLEDDGLIKCKLVSEPYKNKHRKGSRMVVAIGWKDQNQ